LHDKILLSMSSILDFCGLYFCAAKLPANNFRIISSIYVRGYLQGSENGRVVTIARMDKPEIQASLGDEDKQSKKKA